MIVVACLWLAPGAARPVGPPPKPGLSLKAQLELIDALHGEFKLAGRIKDRYVVELDISRAPDWRENLKLLTAFDRLERLYLPTDLKDADIDDIARLRSLRALDLSKSVVLTSEACRKIATMPLLEKLVLTGDQLDSHGAVPLGGLRRLRYLHYDYIRDAGLTALARCPRLEHLHFEYGNFTEAGTRAFASMKRLEYLNMGFTKMEPNAQVHLHHLTGMRWLMVSKVEIGDAGFEAITRLPLLERLHFSVYPTVGPSDEALAKISRLKKLKSCVGCKDDKFLEAVSKCPDIEWIHAVDCEGVTDAGVTILSRCPKLRELDFGNTGVTDACIPTLIKMKGLRRISLGRTKITQAGFDRLERARPDLTYDFRAPENDLP